MTIKRKVTKVIDGDTFLVNKEVNGSKCVRLANINTPEKNQVGYKESTNKLKRLIEGKTVTIRPVGKSYGRIVADVRKKGYKINKK